MLQRVLKDYTILNNWFLSQWGRDDGIDTIVKNCKWVFCMWSKTQNSNLFSIRICARGSKLYKSRFCLEQCYDKNIVFSVPSPTSTTVWVDPRASECRVCFWMEPWVTRFYTFHVYNSLLKIENCVTDYCFVSCMIFRDVFVFDYSD